MYDMFLLHRQLVHARCVFWVLCLFHLKLLKLYARLAGCVSCRDPLGYVLAFESLETL